MTQNNNTDEVKNPSFRDRKSSLKIIEHNEHESRRAEKKNLYTSRIIFIK